MTKSVTLTYNVRRKLNLPLRCKKVTHMRKRNVVLFRMCFVSKELKVNDKNWSIYSFQILLSFCHWFHQHILNTWRASMYGLRRRKLSISFLFSFPLLGFSHRLQYSGFKIGHRHGCSWSWRWLSWRFCHTWLISFDPWESQWVTIYSSLHSIC
jgi:hypothetical protein